MYAACLLPLSTQGVSGAAHPGRLCALMGPSGAGKSTLMDILAGRKTEGDIKGEVTVNGSPCDNSRFLKVAGYVPQVTDGADTRAGLGDLQYSDPY